MLSVGDCQALVNSETSIFWFRRDLRLTDNAGLCLQTEKFDPNLDYVKKWVLELGTTSYPKPVVDHQHARNRVLAAYKKALQPA